MIFDETIPRQDQKANRIAEFIRDTKVQIRERFEAYNGTFEEHNKSDSDDAGVHVPGKVSFTYVSDDADKISSDDLKKGTLHYISDTDSKGLHIVDDSLSRTKAASSDHDLLDGLSEGNPHPQYVHIGGDYSPGSDITIGSLNFRYDYSDNKLEHNNDAIPYTHRNLHFYTAHGERALAYRLLWKLDSGIHKKTIRSYCDGSWVEEQSGNTTEFTFGGPDDDIQELPDDDIHPFLLLGRIGDTDIKPYTVSRDTDGTVTVKLDSQSDIPSDTLEQSGDLYGDDAFYAFRYRSS